MNMKKTLTLLLALALMLGTLSGCDAGRNAPAATEAPEVTEAPEATEVPAETPDPAADPDQIDADDSYQKIMDAFAAARAKHDGDEVVCTIDGQEITWDLYFYLLSDDLMTAVYYMGGMPDDYGLQLTEDMTMEQYLKESAVSKAKYYSEAYAQAVERDVVLSEEQEQELQDYMDQMIEEYGGEEELAAAMAESNLTPEVFRYLMRSTDLLTNLMESSYGAQGEKMSEEDVLAWADEQGYIRIKHILYFFYDDAGAELDEEGKAAQKVRAEETLAQLRELEDDREAMEALFDEKMNADSGDAGGLSHFPDGYTFTAGTMYPVFEEAAFALEDYALSEPVESQSGYHILLRLPLDTEGATMDQDSNTGAYLTLRQSAANDLFGKELAGWIKDAEVEWAPGFEELDLNDLFDAPGPQSTEEPTEEPAEEEAAEEEPAAEEATAEEAPEETAEPDQEPEK